MLLLLATVVLPNALALAQTRGRVTRSGHWTTVHVPEFGGRGPITSFGIAPYTPSIMFVTDGKDVWRTGDGGSTWDKVYSVTGKTPLDHGYRGDAATIESIHVSRSLQAAGRVLLVVEERTQGAVRPFVVRTENAGEDWEAGNAGLPPAGDPEALVLNQADPAIAYLGVDLGGGTLDLIFRSTDGGATWLLRNDLTQTDPNRAITGLEGNPLKPDQLWAYGPDGLFRSDDGGATFIAQSEFQNGSVVSVVEVFQAQSREWPIVFAFRSSHEDVRVSSDNGKTWLRIDTPGVVDSAAYGRTPNELLISTGGRIHFFDHTTTGWPELRVPRPGITGLVSDLTPEVDFYGRTAGTIEIYDGPVSRFGEPDPDGGPDFEVPELEGGVPPKRPPPALTPGGTKLRMKTGAKKVVDYRLKISAKDTPLDLFFLIDTSDTMSGTIQGLIDSVGAIINQLNAAGLDAHFGLGISRAYTDTAVPREPCQSETDTNCERNFIYRRLVDLADFSNHEQLETALGTLRAEAGGRFDSQLGALWAIATGEEINDGPATMEESDVPAGQDASFRKDAGLRLVFVATDEPFATGDEGERDFPTSDFGRITPPDIPTFDEVAGAFGDVKAKVLGLAIGQTLKTDRDSVEGGAPSPLEDMQKIAGLTGAVAPSTGVDCDGDGATDLQPGMELVCPVRRHNVDDGKNLAAAITKLVEAVRGTTEIELEVVRGEDVVAGVTPSTYPAVVEQKPNALDFEVTYRCPDRLQGKTVTVELAANDPARTLDSVVTKVTCLEEKVEEPPLLPLDPVAVFGVVLPPLLPPAPPPIVEIAPGAQGQAQTQSQAQAQGAMAHQEQEQPQLAYVGATIDHREAMAEEELGMSDHRRRSEVPPWATLGTGAAMMSLAYGWLTLSRQRSFRVQHVRRR
jgi:hypothetical protein